MRIFVGYGYNERDAWVEQHVVPILRAMSIDTVDGKDMHGEVLQEGVKNRIDIADAVVGFCTLRQGQEKAAFNTHVWVRDELMYALGAGKPIVEVREQGVNEVAGLKGNRQYIPLDQMDRLSCVRELVQAVAGWSMRRLLLVPSDQQQARKVLAGPRKPVVERELPGAHQRDSLAVPVWTTRATGQLAVSGCDWSAIQVLRRS